jgi:hypothetical protein
MLDDAITKQTITAGKEMITKFQTNYKMMDARTDARR